VIYNTDIDNPVNASGLHIHSIIYVLPLNTIPSREMRGWLKVERGEKEIFNLLRKIKILYIVVLWLVSNGKMKRGWIT
jgi:hypothetical protein